MSATAWRGAEGRRLGPSWAAGRWVGRWLAVCAVIEGMGADPGGPAERGLRPLTLRECVATALQANRDLQVERLNPEVELATLMAAYGLYDPWVFAEGRWENASDSGGFDPADFSRDAVYDASSEVVRAGVTGLLPSGLAYTLTGDYANSQGARNTLNFDSHKVTAGVTLRQPLLKNLWIDPARYMIRVQRRRLAVSELGVQFVVLDVVRRVEQAYYEFRLAHEHLDRQRDLLESRQQLFRGVRRQLEEGLATVSDEHLALARLETTEAAHASARSAVFLAENVLRTHLGDPFTNQVEVAWYPADPLGLPPADLDLERRWRQGLAARPDLRQFREALAEARLTISFHRNQLFPALDLVGGYGRKGASVDQVFPPAGADAAAGDALDQLADGMAPSDMIGLVFSVPLGRVADRARYRASQHQRAQGELRLQQKAELVLREISDAVHLARTSLERAQAARRGVTHARAAYRAEARRLEGGKSTLLDVLQLQDQLNAIELTAVRATADYNQALAQLNFADASAPALAGIEVEGR